MSAAGRLAGCERRRLMRHAAPRTSRLQSSPEERLPFGADCGDADMIGCALSLIRFW
jgi:hypothetical protein